MAVRNAGRIRRGVARRYDQRVFFTCAVASPPSTEILSARVWGSQIELRQRFSIRTACCPQAGRSKAMADLRDIPQRIMETVRPHIGAGDVATYIPELGKADPEQFGLAVATVGGEVYGVGAHDVRFSMQSISKVFTLALVLSHHDEDIWRRLHREPSGSAFNSLFQPEFEQGIPRQSLYQCWCHRHHRPAA